MRLHAECSLRRTPICACMPNVYISCPCRRVQGGSDKDALMMQLMQQSSSAHTPPNSSNNHGSADESKLAVYVGDSPSDFAPLLRADLGIVVGQNKLLRRVAKAQGVKLKPLTAGQHGCA